MTDALPLSPLCAELSLGEQAAAFIATLLAGESGESLAGRRIVLLGSLPRRSFADIPPLPGRFLWDERVRLCVCLLRRGGTLVVLDCPRSRLLIEMLLPLAADGQGHWQGDCLVERDLSSACRDAAALLVLPGWRQPPTLTWRALAVRMRPPSLLFDLRPAASQPPESCGLRVWRLGGVASWG
jgi:hypothetical protein